VLGWLCFAGGYIGHRMDKQAQRIEQRNVQAEVTRVGEGINLVFNEGRWQCILTLTSLTYKRTQASTLDRFWWVFLKEYPDTNISLVERTYR